MFKVLDVKEAAILHKYMTAAGNCIVFEDPGKYTNCTQHDLSNC